LTLEHPCRYRLPQQGPDRFTRHARRVDGGAQQPCAESMIEKVIRHGKLGASLKKHAIATATRK
jgi:hypothetical protein